MQAGHRRTGPVFRPSCRATSARRRGLGGQEGKQKAVRGKNQRHRPSPVIDGHGPRPAGTGRSAFSKCSTRFLSARPGACLLSVSGQHESETMPSKGEARVVIKAEGNRLIAASKYSKESLSCCLPSHANPTPDSGCTTSPSPPPPLRCAASARTKGIPHCCHCQRQAAAWGDAIVRHRALACLLANALIGILCSFRIASPLPPSFLFFSASGDDGGRLGDFDWTCGLT